MNDYTDREMRLIAERDAALTRAEKAEALGSSLSAMNLIAAQGRRIGELEGGVALAIPYVERVDALKAALIEACAVGQSLVTISTMNSERRAWTRERIAELRKPAEDA